MLCLYCNAPLGIKEPLPAQSLFDVCPWCGSYFIYTQEEAATLVQCCECGVFLNGPYTGIQRIELMGVISHGMCNACACAKLAAWHAHKLRVKQAA